MLTTISSQQASDLFRQPPDRWIDVGDEAAVGVRTVGSGPDLLFVHGFPVNGATYRGLLPHLAEHATCHVLDLPGAGSSRFTDTTEITFDRHVAAVRQVVDALGLERFVVAGMDSGGLIARLAFADDPRLAGMALLDTEQSAGASLRFKMFISNRKVPGFGAIFGWLCRRKRLRRLPGAFGGSFVDGNLFDGEFQEFFLGPLGSDRRIRSAAVRLMKSFDMKVFSRLGEVHARIDVPVQLIWGRHDPFFPLAKTEEMVDDFDDAELTVIEDAALFAHEEQPAAVAAALRRLLERAAR